ncbi:hypothetical protein [uncultured Algoriphagus sp.]|uniref:hypothetical protein n=1 Tax=uncultured Algoriphagus sp. TaxID=417365 RepID=UPI0030EF3E9D
MISSILSSGLLGFLINKAGVTAIQLQYNKFRPYTNPTREDQGSKAKVHIQVAGYLLVKICN